MRCCLGALALGILIVGPLSLPADGQERPRSLPEFRALLRSGERVEGRDGLLTTTLLQGVGASGGDVRVPLQDLRVLDVAVGDRAAEGLAIGAGLGLLTSLAAWLQVEVDPEREVVTGKLVQVTAGLIGVGGLVGYLLGSGSREWEAVPIERSDGPPGVARMTLFSFRILLGRAGLDAVPDP